MITDLQRSVAENTKNSHWLYRKVTEMEAYFNRRVNELQNHINMLEAKVFVQDRVSDELLKEINRLEQRNRRPCAIIEGIEKKKGETSETLRKHVVDILDQVETDISIEQVDKFHRNGPIYDGKRQDIIVRFDSHSAKEKVYKARKKTRNNVRIKPSLTRRNKDLLRDARKVIEDLHYDLPPITDNPPEYIFPNVHGEVVVKFTKETDEGMFVTIDSLEHLYRILHLSDDHFDTWDYFENESNY